ncbi:uncharacterized protein, partial [Acropora muricata]|uniref:uncharacterized protein n=1 Tax=Acropora muricata TaxID=159855 RepID=UPI0034E5E359
RTFYQVVDSQQKSATVIIVFRAGTKHGPSFNLKDKSINEVWLVKDPRLYFPLNQEIPQSTRCQKGKSLENICLWETDIANLRKNFILKVKFDAVCQVELKDSTNANYVLKGGKIQEIQRWLESFKSEWRETTVPKCKGGLSLMNLSPLVQAVVVYMVDHFPTTPEELNFHAELKAASQWCWSDDYHQLVRKEVPADDCRLKLAASETLKAWEKEEKQLQKVMQRIRANNMDEDESIDEQLSDVREAIGVLKKYLGRGDAESNKESKSEVSAQATEEQEEAIVSKAVTEANENNTTAVSIAVGESARSSQVQRVIKPL